VRRRLLLVAALGAALALAPGAAPGSSSRYVVARVADGDTLTLTSGARVRLVQVDSPEIGTGECYAQAARRELLRLTPVGSRVALEGDPALDRVDRNGRLLRYVRRGALDVNLELVRRGAAAPYFYRGDRGKYASRLLSAAVAARASRRGLWGASPGTRLDPYRQVDTGRCFVR
jgi:endonuclease YncB( thermonuclease family)